MVTQSFMRKVFNVNLLCLYVFICVCKLYFFKAPWLPRVADLLQLYGPKEYTVTVRRLIAGLTDNNFRAVLRRVKLSEDLHIIVVCSTESLPEVLKQVRRFVMGSLSFYLIVVSAGPASRSYDR